MERKFALLDIGTSAQAPRQSGEHVSQPSSEESKTGGCGYK
jgi:hypothetical protein